MSRAKLLFSRAPERLRVFRLVKRQLSAKDIARKVRRTHSHVLHDLEKMRDLELIMLAKKKSGAYLRKDGCSVYVKNPLIAHLPIRYFERPVVRQPVTTRTVGVRRRRRAKTLKPLAIPSEAEILDICRKGEDQFYEFKRSETDVSKLTREVSAFANTSKGGMMLFGVDDNGKILGANMRTQDLDQRLQNSIHSSIDPPAIVRIKEKTVLGTMILVIVTNPWDRKSIHQHNDGRVYIRRGTNVLTVKSNELKKLARGEPIV